MARSNGWVNTIYSLHSEIPDYEKGSYDNSEWIDKQIARVKNFNQEKDIAIKRNKLLIDTVNNIRKEEVFILDYGGGFGLSYLPLIKSTEKKIKYHIVEIEGVSKAASEFYHSDQSISFSSCIKEAEKKDYDIAYIRTSLQYATDWKKVLNSIGNAKPEKIIMSDASIGNTKTFLTFQSWGSQKIPYWFINENELIDLVVSLGYVLEKRYISRDIILEESWKTQREYPEEYRIDTLKDLVFKRVQA